MKQYQNCLILKHFSNRQQSKQLMWFYSKTYNFLVGMSSSATVVDPNVLFSSGYTIESKLVSGSERIIASDHESIGATVLTTFGVLFFSLSLFLSCSALACAFFYKIVHKWK